MAGMKISMQSFSRETDRMSSGDVLRGIYASSIRTSSMVTGWKTDNLGLVYGHTANTLGLDYCGATTMLSWMRLTLSV